MPLQDRIKYPLMALAGLGLLVGLWAGLKRLGWDLPALHADFSAAHGPLMVSGFLGTLIGLERAIALKWGWAYGAPLFGALSVLALLFNLPPPAVQLPASASSLFLSAIFILLYRRHPANFLATMGTAALLWLIGNLLSLAGLPVNEVVPWWIGFLVLTIAGERLELSRLLRLSRWDSLKFTLSCGLFCAGLAISLLDLSVGVWLGGAGLIALSFWLLRYDIAWRNVRQQGLPRFMGASLLTGYAWLAVGGALWMGFADDFVAGQRYDAMLHAIFLGFAFSMIFAHAPIIFPSITGMSMPFQPAFYGHLILLHLSLLLRVGGDLSGSEATQQWGGLLNAAAILLFLVNNIRAVKRGHAGLGR